MKLYSKLGKLKGWLAALVYALMLGLLIASVIAAGSIEMRIIGGMLLFMWIAMGITALWIFVPQWDPWLKHARRMFANNKIVALTFDDGPTEPWTTRILDILKQHDVRATFFVVGEHARQYPHIVKRAFDEGHVIGGHTSTHRILTFLGTAERMNEIETSIDAIEHIIGCRPNFFRLPHGFKFPGMYKILKQWNLVAIPWTRGLWDTAMPPADVLVRRCTGRLRPLEVVLLHDGVMDNDPDVHREHVITALPTIIAEYRSRGYRFATIAELGEATCTPHKEYRRS